MNILRFIKSLKSGHKSGNNRRKTTARRQNRLKTCRRLNLTVLYLSILHKSRFFTHLYFLRWIKFFPYFNIFIPDKERVRRAGSSLQWTNIGWTINGMAANWKKTIIVRIMFLFRWENKKCQGLLLGCKEQNCSFSLLVSHFAQLLARRWYTSWASVFVERFLSVLLSLHECEWAKVLQCH